MWLGCSAEDQQRFDQRWPVLSKIPAAVRFVSYEPALGPIRLRSYGPWPDWMIVGGESGPGARPMDDEWAISMRGQCVVRRIAFFFKQWGTGGGNRTAEHKGGNVLEGRVWDQSPPDPWAFSE